MKKKEAMLHSQNQVSNYSDVSGRISISGDWRYWVNLQDWCGKIEGDIVFCG